MAKADERAFSKDEIIAEEDLVIDVQFLIQDLLDTKAMTRSELAKKLGLSKARLSQIMQADANPTLRTLARIAYALGERLCIDTRARRDSLQPSVPAKDEAPPLQMAWPDPIEPARIETGSKADAAYAAMTAFFARPPRQLAMRDVSQDQTAVSSDELFVLTAA
jgi:transcriptional regulator with XRE-family HTH domain